MIAKVDATIRLARALSETFNNRASASQSIPRHNGACSSNDSLSGQELCRHQPLPRHQPLRGSGLGARSQMPRPAASSIATAPTSGMRPSRRAR